MTLVEIEQAQTKLATIDQAVSAYRRLKGSSKEEVLEEVGQYREQDRQQRVSLANNDVWALFWMTTNLVSLNPKNKVKFEKDFKKPYSREAIWEVFGGKEIDPTKANLPVKK